MSDDRFHAIEEAIKFLMSKHGIDWSFSGVYEPVEDKEETNE